jgi:hypothetical protein
MSHTTDEEIKKLFTNKFFLEQQKQMEHLIAKVVTEAEIMSKFKNNFSSSHDIYELNNILIKINEKRKNIQKAITKIHKNIKYFLDVTKTLREEKYSEYLKNLTYNSKSNTNTNINYPLEDDFIKKVNSNSNSSNLNIERFPVREFINNSADNKLFAPPEQLMNKYIISRFLADKENKLAKLLGYKQLAGSKNNNVKKSKKKLHNLQKIKTHKLRQ